MRSIIAQPSMAQEMVPPFTWTELEDRLIALAPTPVKKSMARTLVSAVRKQSWALPTARVLDEILALAWVLNDRTFDPVLETEPDVQP